MHAGHDALTASSLMEQVKYLFFGKDDQVAAEKLARGLHASFKRLSMKNMFEEAESFDETRHVAFTFAVIALSAKLIKTDGVVTKQEYLAFREVFPMQPSQDNKIRSLFMMALNETSPAEQYARQIVSLFPARKDLYRDLLESLLKIATSDKALQQVEYDYLAGLSKIFGFKRVEWKKMVRLFSVPRLSDPYQTLGVRKDISDSALKGHYRQLMRRYHPDHHRSQGAKSDVVELMTLKVAALNDAYSQIRQQRGTKQTQPLELM